MISRMSSMPVWEAASISITSTWRPSMIAAQCSPSSVHVDGRAVDLAGDRIVERAGEDAGGGRLADAADAGEHVGLRDAAGAEGVGQRPDHRLLADQVGEALRPVFARQHAVGAAAAASVSSCCRPSPATMTVMPSEGRNANRPTRSAVPKEKWEAGTDDPRRNSLGLLPSGPDPVGERARPPPASRGTISWPERRDGKGGRPETAARMAKGHRIRETP